MNIPKSEYEQNRHIFELCHWINRKLDDFRQEPCFEQHLFERIGVNVKKLLEEAIPISLLGLYLYPTWGDVFVRCFTDNREYDAIIEIQTPSMIENEKKIEKIKVEVTTTEDNCSAMQRQALSRNGVVHFTGAVRREGRNIISEGAFVNTEEECSKLVQLALQRLDAKLENTYDDATAILIYVTAHHRTLAHRHRFKLVKETIRLLREKKPDLFGVFFCYTSNFGIDGVHNDHFGLRL